MRKIFLLLALLVIIGCQSDFKGNFDRLEKISKEHGTSFFTERLNTTVVPLGKITPLIDDLDAVKVRDNASIRFKDARINMLRSELYWQLAMDIGAVGRVEDGFKCEEKAHIKRAEDYFNKTHFYGLAAYNGLDLLLRDYPEYRDIVGVGENKTKFYYSPIFWANERAKLNEVLYDQVCNRKMNATEINRAKNNTFLAINKVNSSKGL